MCMHNAFIFLFYLWIGCAKVNSDGRGAAIIANRGISNVQVLGVLLRFSLRYSIFR
jgi:hypothetical protein